eukprot:c21537_g1_i1 orf=986-2815(-)
MLRIVLCNGKASGSLSKLPNRKQANFGDMWDWSRLKRCPANVNRKAQSTISFCVGALVFSVLLLILCGTDPSKVSGQPRFSGAGPEIETDLVKEWKGTQLGGSVEAAAHTVHSKMTALKGMGTVYRIGTRAMNELLVAHVSESTLAEDFRLFMRTLHRSGATARADLVLLLPWSTPPASIIDVIFEEENSFRGLLSRIQLFTGQFPTNNSSVIESRNDSRSSMFSPAHLYANSTLSPFNFNAFRKAAKEGDSSVQPLWGERHGNLSQGTREVPQDAAWGSIVSFEVSELNPDDALRGFIDQPPLQLRRWACYQMLLGMVRHKFKHIVLVEASGVLVLRDPLAVLRRKSGLYLSLEDRTWAAVAIDEEIKQINRYIPPNGINQTGNLRDRELLAVEKDGNREPEEEAEPMGTSRLASKQSNATTEMHRKMGRRRRRRKATLPGICERVYGRQMWSSLEEAEKKKRLINSDAVLGEIHQIRGLANAMVIEIVKVALDRKNRRPFPDNVLLSYLLHKSSVLGKRVLEHLHLLSNQDSFVHSLIGSNQSTAFFKKGSSQPYAMIHGYNKSKRWRNIRSEVQKQLCSSSAQEAALYPDCNPDSGSLQRGKDDIS